MRTCKCRAAGFGPGHQHLARKRRALSVAPAPFGPAAVDEAVPVVVHHAPVKTEKAESTGMKIDEGRDCVQKRAAFDTLKNALMSVRITGMTWRRSDSGCGIQKGKPEYLPRHARRSQTCCLRYRWRSSSLKVPLRHGHRNRRRKRFTPVTSVTAKSSRLRRGECHQSPYRRRRLRRPAGMYE